MACWDPDPWNIIFLSRREATQAKKEAESQGDVVQALRRDLAGAAARMSDMAGELSDKQKQKLEQYEERILEQDTELEEQRKQLVQLSALVDEQQKEINSREDKLSEQQKVCGVCKICNSIAEILHWWWCKTMNNPHIIMFKISWVLSRSG